VRYIGGGDGKFEVGIRINVWSWLGATNAKYREAKKEITRLRVELRAKCDKIDQVNARYTTWKNDDEKRRRAAKAKTAALATEHDNLRKVRRFHNVICVLLFLFCVSFISN
jgi:hypothetical protein